MYYEEQVVKYSNRSELIALFNKLKERGYRVVQVMETNPVVWDYEAWILFEVNDK